MPRLKPPARSKRKDIRGQAAALGMNTGCARQQVAPATPNCTCEPERRSQSRASQTARLGARNLDGEPARRLPEIDPILTSNTVASRGSHARE
jgi:hypothetical protein